MKISGLRDLINKNMREINKHQILIARPNFIKIKPIFT